MPIYEYECDRCGDFTYLAPLADHRREQACPACHRLSPRVIRTAPAVSGCSSALRAAHRRAETSAERPRRVRAPAPPSGGHAHPARAGRVAGGRPWMLSH